MSSQFLTRRTLSLRGLQLFSILSASIAILGGGAFVLNGIEGVPMVVGREYPDLVAGLELVAAKIDAEPRVTFDHWYRVLGWYWLMTGVMLLWIVREIQYKTAWFRFIHIGFMAVGISSLLSINDYGTNAHNRYGAVLIELLVPLAAIAWQWHVARTLALSAAEQDVPADS